MEASETSGSSIDGTNMVESPAASIEVNVSSIAISNHIDITSEVDQVEVFTSWLVTTYSNEINISVKVQKSWDWHWHVQFEINAGTSG